MSFPSAFTFTLSEASEVANPAIVITRRIARISFLVDITNLLITHWTTYLPINYKEIAETTYGCPG